MGPDPAPGALLGAPLLVAAAALLPLLWLLLWLRLCPAPATAAKRDRPFGEEADSEDDEAEPARDAKEEILSGLRVTKQDVATLLAVRQRYDSGVAHPDWLGARRNRVTASRFASACGLRTAKSTPTQVIADMQSMPESDPRQAKAFGVTHEDKARDAYVRLRRAQGRKGNRGYSFEVREVGVCVWAQEPWLAASPDGVCWENGAAVGLLEVKTSQRWTRAAEERLSGSLPVDWLYQVQGGMRMASAAMGTELRWCDLFFWTPQHCGRRRVNFDAELWEKAMYPKLRLFYFEQFLPAVVAERARAARPSRAGGAKIGRRKKQK